MNRFLPILAATAFLLGCGRRLPSTPPYMVIRATAASCEPGTPPDTWAECRYTVEDRKSMHVRRIVFIVDRQP